MPVGEGARRLISRVFLGVAAVSAAAVGAYVVLRLVPDWLDQPKGLSPAQQALERGRHRTAGLAYVVAVLTAIGAVYTALTFRLSRRGQGTERFNKAIELLGHEATHVRIGGIHALGQLARDDPHAHHQGVLEVLLAYVRDRSPWPPSAPSDRDAADTAPSRVAANAPRQHPPPSAPDIQAAMTILSRRKTAYDPDPLNIDLSHTNLCGISAPGICLRGAVLSRTQLYDADLTGADLSDADLVQANLRDAGLEQAILTQASLLSADLVGTRMRSAEGLSDPTTKLVGARYDILTTDWPAGFDPSASGAVIASTDT